VLGWITTVVSTVAWLLFLANNAYIVIVRSWRQLHASVHVDLAVEDIGITTRILRSLCKHALALFDAEHQAARQRRIRMTSKLVRGRWCCVIDTMRPYTV
jgi:hypothetical protein